MIGAGAGVAELRCPSGAAPTSEGAAAVAAAASLSWNVRKEWAAVVRIALRRSIVFCCFFVCVDSSFSSFLISSGSVSGRDAAEAPVESSVCFLLASLVFSCVVSTMGHANPVLGV